MPYTIARHLAVQAERDPQALALLSPGHSPISFGRLYHHVHEMAARLNSLGIGRGDRIALVVPDGPEMTIALLGIATCASVAPLNPGYSATEYAIYLADLQPAALVALAGAEAPAVAVARAQQIPLFELVPEADGIAQLSGATQDRPVISGFSELDDLAFLLYTSGTTARPKLVPFTHRRLDVRVRSQQESFLLTPQDRLLNTLAMFHTGFIAMLTAATFNGGSMMVYAEPFTPEYFFELLDTYRPTWYSAVPTIHAAILDQAHVYPESIVRSALRFIYSSAAALPNDVKAGLEQAFNVPLLEVYGMTEAIGVAGTDLPPAIRKLGSAGTPKTCEVAILAEGDIRLLPAGSVGEIVVRGPGVMEGYLNNPEANALAFTIGWFRTGDLGYLDEDGFLFVTGRIKEQINRGGQKVSPAEVEAVLLEHPAVAQAVVFALPHPTLGENVAAAVVLRAEGFSEHELRRYAAARLVFYKVPSRIMVVAELPKGPTGKLLRTGLAKILGLSDAGANLDAATELEQELSEIWGEVLRLPTVGVQQPFLELGGDSIRATQLITRIRTRWNVAVSLSKLFEASTIAEQAVLLAAALEQANPIAQLPPLAAMSRQSLKRQQAT